MRKEPRLEDIDSIAEVKNITWKLTDELRGQVSSNEYYIVLYFLILYRENLPLYFTSVGDDVNISLMPLDFPKGTNERKATRTEKLYFLHQFFQPVIEKLNRRFVDELQVFFQTIDHEILTKYFPEIFDDLLYKFSKSQGRVGGENIEPYELSKFVCELAGLPDNSKVYNPFAGAASFAVLFDNEQEYSGQEINDITWAIGSLRIIAYNKDGSSRLVRDDSINNWNPFNKYTLPRVDDSFGILVEQNKFDLIIANPPFGMRLPNTINGKFGIIRTCEHFLIEKGIHDLNEQGKLIAVIPQGFLFRSGPEQSLRKFIVDNDLLETIVSIPGGILKNTSIPVTVLVLNKDKVKKSVVKFVDAKKFVNNVSEREKRLNHLGLSELMNSDGESESLRVVTNTTISAFEYNLSLARYFAPKNTSVDKENLQTLNNLVTVIKGQKNSGNQSGKFVRIRDLKNDKLDYQIDSNNIESAQIPRFSQQIAESCLLLAIRWKTLKPTFFKYRGEPIFVSTDIVALKVKESNVDVSYLVSELNSDDILAQIESFRYGSIIPAIKKDDLLNIQINIPSIQVQKAKVQGIIETLAEEKNKELIFFKKIHGLESEIFEQNTYLRHSLAGPASNLKQSLSNVRKILEEKVLIGMPNIMSLKVSENHELSFEDYLNIIERDVHKIADAISRQLRVEPEIDSKIMMPTEIIGFLKNYVNELIDRSDLGFLLEFSFDKETFLDENGEIKKIFINGNLDLLYDLFNNLISNAKAHAFNVTGKHRIEIFILINSEDINPNLVSVLVSNTGRALPSNFNHSDFIRKGSKAGVNAGDGFGGWYINEIIRKMNGSFDIIDETGPEGLIDTDLATTFEINFPIIDTDEEI
jgi:type I restriction enzyme M protein